MARSFPIPFLCRIAAALALFWCTTTLALADAGRRVALVVGNGAYQNAPALPNPPNDARAVAQALRDLDFEVIEATNLDQPAMLDQVDEFSARLEGAEAGLFYYAGHGLQVGGENYLVPIDARLQREAQVRLQTLPLQTVLATMEVTVPTRIVLLDACRDNPLAQQLKRSMGASRSQAVGQGLAEVRTAVGTLIAYATGPGDVAADGQGEHSPFTGALLDHIGTPGLEVRVLLSRVREEVLEQTSKRQVPWDSSSLLGEFYFNLAPQPTAPVTASPTPATSQIPPVSEQGGSGFDERQLELRFWESVDTSDNAADFEAYLQVFPRGTFATLARNRLARLRVTENATPTEEQANATTVTELTTDPPIVTPSIDEARPYASMTTVEQSNSADAALATAEQALGLSRDEWRLLQRALTEKGFDTSGIDGKPGPSTRRSIASWQNSKTIESTGFLTSEQRDQILSDLRISPTPSTSNDIDLTKDPIASVAGGKVANEPKMPPEQVFVPRGINIRNEQFRELSISNVYDETGQAVAVLQKSPSIRGFSTGFVNYKTNIVQCKVQIELSFVVNDNRRAKRFLVDACSSNIKTIQEGDLI